MLTLIVLCAVLLASGVIIVGTWISETRENKACRMGVIMDSVKYDDEYEGNY